MLKVEVYLESPEEMEILTRAVREIHNYRVNGAGYEDMFEPVLASLPVSNEEFQRTVTDLYGAQKEVEALTPPTPLAPKAPVVIEPKPVSSEDAVKSLQAALASGVAMPAVVGKLGELGVKRVTELDAAGRVLFVQFLGEAVANASAN